MLTRFRRLIARQGELKELDASAASRCRPAPADLVQVDTHAAVWRVPVPGQADRFMSAAPGAINDQLFVVRVDAEAFYRAWLRSSSALRKREGDCVLRSEMPLDHTYEHAVDLFARGRRKPVPLAWVGAAQDRDKIAIRFSDGITRSFWLIVNRAPSFPVAVCGRASAELLNQVCGLDSAPLSFTDLFAQAERQAPRSQV